MIRKIKIDFKNLNYKIIKNNEEEFWLKIKAKRWKLRPANIVGEKKCIKCGSCCWTAPCDLCEDDIFKIAEYLNTTPMGLFDDLLTIQRYEENKFVITPIKKDEYKSAGNIRHPYNWFIFSPCIFLDKNNLCIINSVKPICGRNHQCWDNKNSAYFYNRSELLQIIKKINRR